MKTIDGEFDELVRSALDAIFDCRTYYWPNIAHSFFKFTFSFTLPTSIILTWVGVETKLRRQMNDLVVKVGPF